jgi:hypothetical protein
MLRYFNLLNYAKTTALSIILLCPNNTTRYYVSTKGDLSLPLKPSKPTNSEANRLLRALLMLNTRSSLIALEESYLSLKDN